MSLLVDEQIGIFTNGIEFVNKNNLRSSKSYPSPPPPIILKHNVEERAKIADILKIHDFNYI